MKLIESLDQCKKERMDKEHTTIAYKRFLNKFQKDIS